MDIYVEMTKLLDLAAFETGGDSEAGLTKLVASVGDFLTARRVSLMLLDSEGDEGQRLKLVALFGQLPKTAWDEKPHMGQGIAGKVLAEGRPVVVADIEASKLKTAQRHPGESGSFIACPVPVAGQPAGILNVSDHATTTAFAEEDLARAEVAAVLVGRAIQLLRLQGMLNSSFAQMAMTLEGVTDAHTFTTLSVQEPQKVAKILAKAFYKEMHRCGFTSNQILHASSEIISELTNNLSRAKQRRKRLEKPDAPS
jgi:putative methionine-R-sulfoxide reductase with GAF domain